MKKLFKILAVLFLILLISGFTIYFYIDQGEIPSYPIEKIDYQASVTPQAIERGKKLTMMLCTNCHTDPLTGELTGTRMLDAPVEFGQIYSTNITQDLQYGIGNWSDAELLFLLRTGIKKDGQYSPPYMAKLPTMADEDINAIIAFLKSNDPLVQPKAVPNQESTPGFLTKFLCKIAWKPFEMPTQAIPMPDTQNTLEYGKYLAHNLDCFSCHSADFKSNDFLNPEKSKGYFGGGNKTLNKNGEVILTTNLTPDHTHGIGKWTQDEFINSLKYGQKKEGGTVKYPMQPYPYLSDHEAASIYQYLKTIPALETKIE